MQQFEYFMPAKILFGEGRLSELATAHLPGRRALVVTTSGGAMRRQGILERVEILLEQNGVEAVLFEKAQPNPVLDTVTEGALFAKEKGCDFVIGLGGGSAIDTAKAIAVAAKNEGEYWDYAGGQPTKEVRDALPIVAITTTAGTGTEADPWTVITKSDTKEKLGFGCQYTFPTLSIVDPELMVSVPEKLTAYQGFDALFHATEGVLNRRASEMSDLFALKSIELITAFLPRAVRDGKDREARAKVAFANTLSGIVESTSGCTTGHAFEHPISALRPDIAHGAGLIIMSLPYYKYFAKVCPCRLKEMAKVMGERIDGLSDAEGAERFLRALEKLIESCGVQDESFQKYGMDESAIDELTENCYTNFQGLFAEDRTTLSKEDVRQIYCDAFRQKKR